jgi:hypothetical protein
VTEPLTLSRAGSDWLRLVGGPSIRDACAAQGTPSRPAVKRADGQHNRSCRGRPWPRVLLSVARVSSSDSEGTGGTHRCDGAAELIRKAVANSDDGKALSTVCGIYRFGPAMSSVILAACRPGRFTVADSRALKALRALGRMPAGPRTFRQADWLPHLNVCRGLADVCGLSLWELDRALWVAAGDL